VLPRELRLKERHRFQAVYRRGRSWANADMVVHVLGRPGAGTQFGFVVGKKLGGAVQRNRVRRLLREACRGLVPGVPPGVDIVIVGRPAAAEAPLGRLAEGMRTLFQRAGVWTEAAPTEARSQQPDKAALSRPPAPVTQAPEEGV
jgi:ribonuclease P protein component